MSTIPSASNIPAHSFAAVIFLFPMDEIIDNQHHTAEQQGVFQADTAVNVEWIA